MEVLNTYREGPDEKGHFGIFGGRYVAETLMPLILDLAGLAPDAPRQATTIAGFGQRQGLETTPAGAIVMAAPRALSGGIEGMRA